ncbi:hypothetical protein F4804DRAFT_189748 [Jackrogersella minutella]|nr:hypothetical protein F4804DRAFT_189748 [Jackrogersella minutella]
MLTMTRLPTDSFLPSGAILDQNQRPMSFASPPNGHSSASVISPLSLPHALNHFSYLDESHITNISSSNYSHSPLVPVASQSRQEHLSLHRSPPDNREKGSTSLSPAKHRPEPGAASPSLVPSVASPLDGMSANTLLDLLKHREEQNRKMLEGWRAERAQLEMSRAQAEDLYRGERAIMDEERVLWIQEKARLENELFEWKKRAELLEEQKNQMATYIKKTQTRSGQGSISFDGTGDTAVGSIRGGGLGSPEARSQSTGRFQSSSEDTSPSTVPSILRGPTMPESKPFIPLDPRMQGLSPGAGSPKTQQERIPSIDIQEVMPELEGIRVRPDAVQKTTFTFEKSSSPLAGPKKLSPPAAVKRLVPGELTKEALQAPESDRLTMHAGHTPNHSMSLSRLHTVESTVVTTTTDSSGASTPKHRPAEGGQAGALGQALNSQIGGRAGTLKTGLDSDTKNEFGADRLGPVPILVPRERDPALKGPLHLRNLPAADEPFLLALADKLEQVKANNASPTVLKDEPSPKPRELNEHIPESIARTGGDGVHDAHEEQAEDDEEEIPLKLKVSSNFGAPLGQLRKPSKS